MSDKQGTDNKLSDTTIFVLGFVILVIKIAIAYGFVWLICMFAILGIETLVLDKNVIEVGILNLPMSYYISAGWFSLALFGFAQFMRQSILSGVFNLAKRDNDEPTNTEN